MAAAGASEGHSVAAAGASEGHSVAAAGASEGHSVAAAQPREGTPRAQRVTSGEGLRGFNPEFQSTSSLAVPGRLSVPRLGLNSSSVSFDHGSSSSSTNISRVSSVGDLPNQTGNTGRREDEENDKELFSPGEELSETLSKETWEINYREAAIFLDEGMNNDKFVHHPRNKESLPAYLLVHSRWFNAIDFCASLVILSLGILKNI